MTYQIQVMAGETLMKALARQSIALDAPCGGGGSCGKCRVRVLSGPEQATTPEEKRLLGEEGIQNGWRLACAVNQPGNWHIELPEKKAGERIMTEGAGEDCELDPASRIICLPAEKPQLHLSISDAQRVAPEMNFTLSALRQLPDAARKGENIWLAVFRDGELPLVTACFDRAAENLGVAVDLGTTTIAAYLIDLNYGNLLDCASCMNPQRAFGGDVISRANHAVEGDGLNDLQRAAAEAIDHLVDELLKKAGKSREGVRHIVCVGNTIMMHLLAGLTPEHIARSPFTPVYARGFAVEAEKLGVHCPAARLTLGPCVAGYVGADTVAAALACAMDEEEDVCLLIDIGTNGEIVLGNRESLLCCSAAAGPAFEGAHIRCGSAAQTGAVDHVRLKDGRIELSVIGGGKPRSLCGSGLVDAVAELLREGILDETGRLDEDEAPETWQDCLFDYEGGVAFSLDGLGDKGVFICQQDIREVQLAKSAIAAGVGVLLKEAGLDISQVKTLFLAGGFGNYIAQDSAAAIGLLPKAMEGRIIPVGNAAGSGARQMLKSVARNARAEEIRAKMRYVELSARSDFQELFVEEMLFPEE